MSMVIYKDFLISTLISTVTLFCPHKVGIGKLSTYLKHSPFPTTAFQISEPKDQDNTSSKPLLTRSYIYFE